MEIGKSKNYPVKFKEFPGLSPRNLFKISEGNAKSKIVEADKIKLLFFRIFDIYFLIFDFIYRMRNKEHGRGKMITR
ncbi:MAG: hypothetical protein ABSH16_07235 [Sedimentisphaerales bacterium]